MQEDVDHVIPEVLAWRDRDRFRMWCEFCDGWHFHRKLGVVAARCPTWTPFTANGYLLVDGGRWHSGKTVRYSKRKL
jgi:hypothetical protein